VTSLVRWSNLFKSKARKGFVFHLQYKRLKRHLKQSCLKVNQSGIVDQCMVRSSKSKCQQNWQVGLVNVLFYRLESAIGSKQQSGSFTSRKNFLQICFFKCNLQNHSKKFCRQTAVFHFIFPSNKTIRLEL
jgi:hypothetical protein